MSKKGVLFFIGANAIVIGVSVHFILIQEIRFVILGSYYIFAMLSLDTMFLFNKYILRRMIDEKHRLDEDEGKLD